MASDYYSLLLTGRIGVMPGMAAGGRSKGTPDSIKKRKKKLGTTIQMPTIPNADINEVSIAIIRSLTTLTVGKVTYSIPESAIRISMDGKSSRMTKGRMIWERIQEIVESGEYVDRETIASECHSTVSRVAEILKEKSEHSASKQYRRMAAEEKIQRSLSREIEKENRHASLVSILNEDYEKEMEENGNNDD